MNRAHRIRALCCATTLGLVATNSFAASRVDSGEGGLVIEALEGQAAKASSLQVGDILKSWSRTPQSKLREAAGGRLASPFDLMEVEVEQAPRGPVELRGTRAGKPIQATLHGEWTIRTRPHLTGEALADYEAGKQLVTDGKPAEGLAHWRRVLDVERTAKRWPTACWLALRLAEQSAALPEGDRLPFDTVNELCSPWSRKDVLAAVTESKARTLETLGRSGDAENAWQDAVRRRQKSSTDSLPGARALNRLGALAWSRGDIPAAEAAFKQALDVLEKQAPESVDSAVALDGLGIIARTRSDLVLARTLLNRSLSLGERWASGSLTVARTLLHLSYLAVDEGDVNRSEVLLRQALAVAEGREPGGFLVTACLNALGNLASVRGDLAAAEGLFLRIVRIAENRPPLQLVLAAALVNLGGVAANRLDWETAQGYSQRGLELLRLSAPRSLIVAQVLGTLGTIARGRADKPAADRYLREELEITRALAPSSDFLVRALLAQGRASLEDADFARAESLAEEARQVSRGISEGRYLEGEALAILARIDLKQQRCGAARVRFGEALVLEERWARSTVSQAALQHNLGLVDRCEGRLEEAAEWFLKAVNTLESQMGRLGGGDGARSGFGASQARLYQDTLTTLVDLGRREEAFHLLERSRARRLIEALAERDVIADRLPRELDLERRRVDLEYDRVQGSLLQTGASLSEGEVSRALARLSELRSERQIQIERIREASPRLASVRYPQAFDLAQARQALDAGTVLLAYAAGTERTLLFAVRSAQDGGEPLAVFELPLRESVLQDRVDAFRDLLTHGGSVTALTAEGRSLYRDLLAPAEAFLAGSRRLLVSPDGPLHALPFGALTGPGVAEGRDSYLAQRRPLHFIGSVTLYAAVRGSRPPETRGPARLVAFGDPDYGSQLSGAVSAAPAEKATPDLATLALLRAARRDGGLLGLPGTRREVQEIAKLFGADATVLMGTEATEERAKALGRDTRYLHFACHGLLDERSPLNSGLALAIPDQLDEGRDNGILQAWEIFDRVRIDADLVTLSACDSGLGREAGGEGLMGLTRAFLYAGAHSVLASLWSVADDSTAVLMQRFYGFLREGKSKDEALRLAQVSLIHEAGRSHPGAWAAFQLTGDWR